MIGTNAGKAAYASPANGKFLGKSALVADDQQNILIFTACLHRTRRILYKIFRRPALRWPFQKTMNCKRDEMDAIYIGARCCFSH